MKSGYLLEIYSEWGEMVKDLSYSLRPSIRHCRETIEEWDGTRGVLIAYSPHYGEVSRRHIYAGKS